MPRSPRRRSVATVMAVMAVSVMTGCAYNAAVLHGLGSESSMIRLVGPVDLVPLSGDPDSVGLVVRLQVTNDRNEAFVVSLEHLQLEQRSSDGSRVVAAGDSAAPLYVPAARWDDGGKPLPLDVRHTFRIDRHSWVPDIIDAVHTGDLYLTGRVRIQARDRVREVDFQWPLAPPAFPWQDPEARSELFGGVRSLSLGFRDLDTLEFDGVLRLRDPLGSSLLLSDVVAVVGLEGTGRGLTIRLPRITLAGLPNQQDVRIQGTVSLKDCDPDTLDRLAGADGRSRLHVTAVASGDGLPPTRIDETFSVALNEDQGILGAAGVPVTFDTLPDEVSRTLVQQMGLGDLANLEAADRDRLLSGGEVSYPVRVRNPFPGTIEVRVDRMWLEGPERYTETGVPLSPLRMVLLTGSSEPVTIGPLGASAVPLHLRLTDQAVGGTGHLLVKLLAGSDFRGYRLTQHIELTIPLLGKVGLELVHELARP